MRKSKAESVTFMGEIGSAQCKPVVDPHTAARQLSIELKLKVQQDSGLVAALARLTEESQVKVTIEAVQGSLEV
jgi:hypothetical protein